MTTLHRVALGSLLAVLLQAPVRAFNTYYASPLGLSTNDGSIDRPLDLVTAISVTSPVHAGDTLWLRGGVYRVPVHPDHNGTPVQYVSYLHGAADAWITVRAYPGERVTLDGNLATTYVPVFVVDGGTYTRYWGFEITNTNPERFAPRGTGLDVYGHHNQFVNLVIHDTGQGVGFWATNESDASLVYGSIISHVGWEESDRGHGHSIYVQNINGIKQITDNIAFEGFSFGLHAYTEGGHIDNIQERGNILFNHGNLSQTGGPKANLLFAGATQQNPVVSDNFLYSPVASSGRNIDMSDSVNGTIERNYTAGGSNPFKLEANAASSVHQNIAYGPIFDSLPTLFPDNAYHTEAPVGTVIGVRPNVYEPGRANVVIYNWDLHASINVNLSGIGLSVGDAFEVRDAQNFFGPPVAGGTYTGAPVAFPMANLVAASVIGNAPIQPGHTGMEFGAFVVLPVGGTVIVPPPPPPPPPPPGVSPDGTILPPVTSIVDGAGAVWTIASNGAILRNGLQAGGGTGFKILWLNSTIYALGSDNARWWQWTGSGWIAIGITQPGGGPLPPPPPPPPPGVSPDGTFVPPTAQITDALGAVWTIAPNGAILRNGAQAAGGTGFKILWLNSLVYVLGSDGSHWWQWAGSGWVNVGTVQPGGGSVTPPPPPLGVSPNGTTVPPAVSIIDTNGAVWTIDAGHAILQNGVYAAGGSGFKILWKDGVVYVLGSDNVRWWKWAGGWLQVPSPL